jgi:putative transcriptional regulator
MLLFACRQEGSVAAGCQDQEGGREQVTTQRTQIGREVESALGEVLAHVRGEVELPGGIIDDPTAERIVALRKRMKLSRQKFADRFGLDARAVQDWEQGRRVPDRAARVLLTVIDREPEAVVRAIGST